MHTLPSTPCRLTPTNNYRSTSYTKRYYVHTCTTKGVCQFLTRICKYSDFPVVMFKKADAPTMQLRIGLAPLSGRFVRIRDSSLIVRLLHPVERPEKPELTIRRSTDGPCDGG